MDRETGLNLFYSQECKSVLPREECVFLPHPSQLSISHKGQIDLAQREEGTVLKKAKRKSAVVKDAFLVGSYHLKGLVTLAF